MICILYVCFNIVNMYSFSNTRGAKKKLLDVIFNDEWIISQNSMAATKVFHFSSTVYLCSRRLSLEWEKMNCSSMLKSNEKWREILCPKELRNHLGDFIKKCGKNIEKQIRLYFFRSRIILHIYQCTDSGEVQVFFTWKQNKKSEAKWIY